MNVTSPPATPLLIPKQTNPVKETVKQKVKVINEKSMKKTVKKPKKSLS